MADEKVSMTYNNIGFVQHFFSVKVIESLRSEPYCPDDGLNEPKSSRLRDPNFTKDMFLNFTKVRWKISYLPNPNLPMRSISSSW